MSDQFKTKQVLIQESASLDDASEYAESFIDTVREPLIVLDKDLRVVTVSRSFYEFFKVKPAETVGQLIYNLENRQRDIPELRELLETILPQKAVFDISERKALPQQYRRVAKDAHLCERNQSIYKESFPIC